MPAAGADLARWLHAELQTLKLAKLRAEERQLALVGEVELLQEQMGRTGEVLSEFGARADDCSRELVSRRARNQRLASDYVHLRERVPDDSAVDTLALESVVDQMRALTDEKIALIDERSKLQGRLKHSEDTIVQNRHTHETLVQAVHMQSSVSAALVGKSEENMQLSFARAAQQQEEQEQQVEQQWERAAPDDRQLAAPLSQQQPFLKRFDLQTERLALLGPMGKEHSPARGSMSRTAVTNSKTVDVQAASIASAAIAAAASSAAATPKAQKADAKDDLLPAHWHRLTDPGSGKVYYQNSIEKTTHWQLPGHVLAEINAKKLQKAAAVAEQSIKLPLLPGGWEEMVEEQSGRVYYQCHHTRQTTWQRPQLPA